MGGSLGGEKKEYKKVTIAEGKARLDETYIRKEWTGIALGKKNDTKITKMKGGMLCNRGYHSKVSKEQAVGL